MRVPALSQPVTGWALSGNPARHPPAADVRHGAVLARVTRAVVFAEALILAGCSDLDRAYHTVTGAVQTALIEPRHSASLRPPPPSPAPSPWGPDGASVATPSPAPTPVVVNGLSSKAVRALLGQPAARAGPAPGETWTYRSGSCEVKLFLFPDVSHGGLQVLDSQVAGPGAREGSKQTCLRRLRDDQRG